MTPASNEPFRLIARPAGTRAAALVSAAARCAERVLGLSTLGTLYSSLPPGRTPESFCDLALRVLGVDWSIAAGDLDAVPRSGSLVIVSNHPFGGLDGLVLGSLLRRVRQDVKFLGNHMLARIPELRGQTICLDPFPGGQGSTRNMLGLRSAIRWVRSGGALLAFPAGEVAHLDARRLRVGESRWLAGVGLIVRASEAPVVPARVEGRNSPLFHAVGCLHPRLRTALLPRELLKKRNHTVAVRLGLPIPFSRLRHLADDREAAAYLQARCELLAAVDGGWARDRARAARRGQGRWFRSRAPVAARWDRRAASGVTVAEPASPSRIAGEVDRLPACSLLVEAGNLKILVGRAEEMPIVLDEIGRLREISFRAVGEGTGRPRDLDAFDAYYLHLFAWNADRQEIVGAYRVGPTDEILPRRGAAGLYTATLFRYEAKALRLLDPALELGRAFVRGEYQRDYAPLMLLWRGIARFVAERPRYRRLFGPVSISNDYDSVSKRILVAFLEANRRVPDLASLVQPRHPPRLQALGHWDPDLLRTLTSDETEVNAIVGELERHQRAMPVLLRQYLRLNARLLAFNVDPAFGDALDGLMLVDLLEVEPAVLSRYMGSEQARAFRVYHAERESRVS